VIVGEHFQPLLEAAFPTMTMWERVILELTATPAVVVATNATVHRPSRTDNDQDRADKIAPTLQSAEPSGVANIGSRAASKKKSGRVGRLVHVRVVPPGP
jgi:hypothetical protein